MDGGSPQFSRNNSGKESGSVIEDSSLVLEKEPGFSQYNLYTTSVIQLVFMVICEIETDM